MKNLLLSLLLLFSAAFVRAGTFTSNVSSGSFNSATTWTFSGDTDGKPDADDDVTILAGDTVTWGSGGINIQCRSLTVSGIFKGLSVAAVAYIGGNYTINGTETGPGNIVLSGVNKIVSGTGSFGLTPNWTISSSNMTIATGVSFTKQKINLGTNAKVTNNGILQLTVLGAYNTGSQWINAAGSALTVSFNGFMSGRTFDASASGNSVTLKYATGSVPLTTAGYYNLTIGGVTSGTKTLPATTVIANNLTINSLNNLNSNGFDLTVGGNWANSGAFTPGTRTVTFNGSSNQTISGTATTAFYNFVKSTSNTITQTANVTVSNMFTMSSGLYTTGTASLSGTGGITMTGGELQIGTLATTVPGLSGTYSVAGSTMTFNGAGAQTIRGGATLDYYNVNFSGSGTKTLADQLDVDGALTIDAGVTLDVSASNYDIHLAGNWTNNGTFVQQFGTVLLHDPALSTINLSGSSTTTFENLVIDNSSGVNLLSGSYEIQNLFHITTGTFTTNGNSFTMLSTATKTARIGQLGAGASIVGDFVVQRFLSSRTQSPTDNPGHWSDMASPVQNATMADWDNELYLYYPYNPPYEQGNVNGFDEPTDSYTQVSAATALLPGQGFEIALTDDSTLTAFTATTLTTTGVPNQGDQDLSARVSFSGVGENLVGNPFASSISWDAVLAASSGLLSTYDEYDSNAGNYATFGAGSEIGQGQGFWVYATAGSPTFIVPESAKTSATNSDVRSLVAEPYMTLKLKGTDDNIPYSHTFKLTASASSSNGWDLNDHPFKKSPNHFAPSLTSFADGRELSINSFNDSEDNYSIALTSRTGITGNYMIEAAGLGNMNGYSCILLEDKFTGKWINLYETASYAFSMKADDNQNRFVLHFSKNGDCRSAAGSSIATDMENNVSITPTSEGNNISFSFATATPVTIDVMNVVGQKILPSQNITASSQTEEIRIPADYSGMYLVRITGANGAIVKKFVRK